MFKFCIKKPSRLRFGFSSLSNFNLNNKKYHYFSLFLNFSFFNLNFFFFKNLRTKNKNFSIKTRRLNRVKRVGASLLETVSTSLKVFYAVYFYFYFAGIVLLLKKVFLGNYIFFFFFFLAFFIVYLWSLGSKFSLVFFWNGAKFTFREDFFKNYSVFNNSGEIYECGFSGVEEPLKSIEIQYLILAIFFIVYEIEFLIFLPLFLYVFNLTWLGLILVLFSFLLLVFSYWYEWEYYLLHFVH